MIVADAMVMAYALVEVPERTEEVNRALEKDATWTSPPLWRSELSLEDALRKMGVAERLIDGRTVEVETEGVLRLADASGLSGYDAEYVRLAEDLGIRLLTTDGPVLQVFPGVAVHPKDFAG